jgi:hypothetical protein
MKIIEAGSKTPKIEIDSTNSVVIISGRLIPENPKIFFEDLTNIVNEVYENNGKILLNFKFEYFNTGAAKYLYEFFKNIKQKNSVNIVWEYEADDEDIYESGKEFSELTGLNFEFKEV